MIGISENGVRFLPLAEPGMSEADEDHLFHTIYDLHPQPAPCEFDDDQYDTCAALAENDHRSCEDKNDQDLALVATTLGAALITCGLCLSTPYTGIGILFCDGCLVSAGAFGGTAMDWSIDIGKMNEEFDRVKANCCIEAESRSKGNPPNDNCCTYQCNE